MVQARTCAKLISPLGPAAVVLVAAIVAACGAGPATSRTPGAPVAAGGIPRCDDVPPIEAAAGLYRDEPIYVANEMPTDAVRAWAQGKPGFEDVWIDRDHHGWVTVAFSRDAGARQAELEEAFPGAGVVTVGVDWTKAELEALQQSVMTDGQPLVIGSGIRPNYGVVSIGVGVLTPETVAAITSKFGGSRVCIEGIDPADAPADGPQQTGGATWRLLADRDNVGPPYRTGIAADAEAYKGLWAAIGLKGQPPEVDFQTEVAVWFGTVHGSSCPRLRLDDVIVDLERSILHADITRFELGACTADAIAHAYVVAVPRRVLPHGPFTIQLEAVDPPGGAFDETTIVDADLSAPGASPSDGQVHTATFPPDEGSRVEPGGIIEPGYPWRYRLRIHCGIEWLGRLNGTWWRTEEPPADGVPAEWQAAIDLDGTIDLEILLTAEPEPRLAATAAKHTITYRPSAEEGPSCR